MIWKLSLTGIRSRLKDYLVLFSGLIIASMTFYMFLTLATNQAFLTTDVQARTSSLQIVFGFGIVLLVIITLLYLSYANSFLLKMRQHDYGIFMLLGAKSSRIGLIIFLETLVTGLLATGAGLIAGFGLTALVAKLLIIRLQIKILHFQVILPSAFLGTVIFFMFVFFLGACRNVHHLTRTPVINLLHDNHQPVTMTPHPLLHSCEAVLGIILLAGGYYTMGLPLTLFLQIVPTALVTIVTGTYLLYQSLFSAIVNFLSQRRNFSYRGLRMFTLGQLKFRLQEYNRILTVISLLFALALGAITVGLNSSGLKEQAQTSTYYDMTVISNSHAVKQELTRLDFKTRHTYHYKEKQQALYFNRTDFTQQPIKNLRFVLQNGRPTYRVDVLPTNELGVPHTYANNVLSGLVPHGWSKKIHLVGAKRWRQLSGQSKFITLLTVKDFDRAYPQLLKIQAEQIHETPQLAAFFNNSKPANYQWLSNFASGFEFMGFFLGLAFLTMLASTLMFKVLSGATVDRPRYHLLKQLGAPTRKLQRSINWEIGFLFLLPGMLGIIDVLFGLQLFRGFLPHPYHNLWLPFLLFGILYLGYYWLTVKLYQRIVLA